MSTSQREAIIARLRAFPFDLNQTVDEHRRGFDAFAIEPVPAGDDLSAVGLTLLEVSQHAIELLLADQRTAHGALFFGSAHLHGIRNHRHALDDLVVDTALHQNSGTAHTGLPGVHEGAERRHRDRLLQFRVIEDQHRRLAAEFQSDLVEVAVGRRVHDRAADLRGAGEGDLLHVGVRGDRRADSVPVTVDEVGHPVGHSGLGQQAHQDMR